ncbi:MarR family transcriptional regulator [Muricoccus radiodurans]|uniref:MarR family transcriptional regulator n=1 Tax=Muricoccus radiodurans TaxID=2231721 RepID=UPI003CF691B2
MLILLSTERDGVLQRDLATQLMIEHPTLVRLLDGLEHQGLIRRNPEPGKRANRIVLTAEAEPVVRAVNAIFARLRDRVLGGLSPDDLRTALRVLNTVADGLDVGSDAAGTKDQSA